MPLPIDNLNVAPYYDTSQQEIEKGYHKFLAIEGQVLQNRELNVAQGLIQGNIRKITDLIIDDASVVSGCNFINNSELEVCYLEEGEIYFSGLLIKVEAKEWSYAQVPENQAYVCVEVSQVVYTESDDTALYDPAENIENTGNRGGHRVKFEAVPVIKSVEEYETEVLDSKNLIAILKLKNRDTYGPLKPKPIFNKVYTQMASRTYDTSGDFIANGLRISTLESDYPEYKYKVKITKGRAYVKGYDYTYDKDQYLLEDTALETRKCGTGYADPAERKIFQAGVYSYHLNKKYIKSIENVTSTIKVVGYDMVNAGQGNDIEIPGGSLISVDLVYMGETIYTNYTLNGTTIEWIGAGPVSSYKINMTILKNITENEDYFITRDGAGTIINFNPNSTNIPSSNQFFDVCYTWYLSRYDLVYMKENGTLSIKRGLYDELNLIKEPSIPAGSLPLAYIKVEPGKTPQYYNVQSFDIYRVPMIQLQTIKRKLNDIEYNFAMSELENIAQNKHLEQEDLYTLKNIFADGVVSYDRVDTSNSTFDATVDLFRSEVRLPMLIDQVDSSKLSFTPEIPENGILQLNKHATTGKAIADMQPYITHNTDIAPYFFKGLVPRVTCDPKKLLHIQDSETARIIWLPNRVIYSSAAVNLWRTVTVNTSDRALYGKSIVSTTSKVMERVSSIIDTEVVESKKNEIELIPNPYIKPGSLLTIVGEDFPANTEIRLYMDEKIITSEFTDPVYHDFTLENVDAEAVEYTYTKESTRVIARPWCWRWRRHWWYWNGKWDWYWRFWAPLPTGRYFYYYWHPTIHKWYWEKTGFVEGNGSFELQVIPSWFKWFRRAPWWPRYYGEIKETLTATEQQLIEYVNKRETVTEIEYPDDYEETNIAIVTDDDGHFEIEIKIPKNIPVGKHTITAETVLPENFNPDRYFKAQDEFSGESYTRHWENEIYMRKVERVTEVIYVETLTTKYRNPDPVAQSFILNEDQFITGLDLYFSHKSSTSDAVVWINVREMENGVPTGPILYYQEIDHALINIPDVGNMFPKTYIEFDYPVFCEAGKEYAFTVGCNVDGFRVYYAKMGNRDLVTNEPVIYQPHPSGVMFTSSNNQTWTPIQDSDLTYTLYRTNFDVTDKVFYINYVNKNAARHNTSFSLMNVSIGDVVLENTDIKYEYAITAAESFDPAAVHWKLLNIEEMYELENSTTDMKLYIKITLSSSDSKVTPTVNMKTFSAFFAKYKTLGSYVQIPVSLE